MPEFIYDIYEKGHMSYFYFAATVVLILIFVFRDKLKSHPYFQLAFASALFAAASYVIHFIPEVGRSCFSE